MGLHRALFIAAAFPIIGTLRAADFQSLENRDAGGLKLLFSTRQDVGRTWGRLQFGATPMRKMRDCAHPGFTPACGLPRQDGAWDVYGLVFARGQAVSDPCGESNTWRLVHATTRDGTCFENVELVFVSEPGPWSGC